MTIRISGTLPAAMAEGSRPGDWSGLLEVSSPLGRITAIEAWGPGALHLSLAWDAARGLLTLRPGAPVDFEGLAALGDGATPEIAVSLRARLASGARVQDATVFRIAVRDLDDTPPTALAFASGGSVVAGAVGAVIGRLAVTDPDTQADAPFHFAVAGEDAWRFEILADGTLKLRDGISLGLDDMPARPLLVEVSDGRNAAGFWLDLTVLDPGGGPGTAPAVLGPGELRGPVALATPERAVVLQAAGDRLVGLGPAEGGQRVLTLDGTGEVPLPDTVRRIEFTDGRLELDPAGGAARAAVLHGALRGGEAADGLDLAGHLAALDRGASLAGLAEALLAAAPGAAPASGDEAFLEGLFHGAAGRAPGAEELALHLGRLGSGVSRAQVAVDVAQAALEARGGAAPARGGGGAPPAGGTAGLWVAQPQGREDPGAGGHAAPPWEAAALPDAEPPALPPPGGGAPWPVDLLLV